MIRAHTPAHMHTTSFSTFVFVEKLFPSSALSLFLLSAAAVRRFIRLFAQIYLSIYPLNLESFAFCVFFLFLIRLNVNVKIVLIFAIANFRYRSFDCVYACVSVSYCDACITFLVSPYDNCDKFTEFIAHPM